MKVTIPKNWTPEQAEAVVDFIADLEFAIRKKYEVKILDYQLMKLKGQESDYYKDPTYQEDF